MELDDAIQALQVLKSAVRQELEKRARTIEERRQWYEREAGKWLKKPVAVKFCEVAGGFSGEMLNRSTGFEIHIAPALPLLVERSAFCHEVGHGLMNHGYGWTEEEEKKSGLMGDVLQSPELSERLGFDAKAMFQDKYRKRCEKEETEADVLGKVLFHFYCRDDEYIKHNSTELQITNKFK